MSRDKKPEPGHSGHWRHGALHHPAQVTQQTLVWTQQQRILSSGSSMADTVYQFTVDTIDGAAVRLDTYRGRVLCIVNVASR